LGNLKKGDNKGIGKMMSSCIFKELGVRCIKYLHFSQDGNMWQTCTVVMKLPVP
jgi:hypothetical protein